MRGMIWHDGSHCGSGFDLFELDEGLLKATVKLLQPDTGSRTLVSTAWQQHLRQIHPAFQLAPQRFRTTCGFSAPILGN